MKGAPRRRRGDICHGIRRIGRACSEKPSYDTHSRSMRMRNRTITKMWTELGFLPPAASVRSSRKVLDNKSKCVVMTAQPTRRMFLSVASSTLLLGLPKPSLGLSREEAEREARLAYGSLPQLSDLVELGDYNGFRMQLRTGAMSRVRASCTAWYRSFEASDERAIKGEKLYRGLIKAVEAADLGALKAERGGDGGVVPGLVRSIGTRFDEFLEVVSE